MTLVRRITILPLGDPPPPSRLLKELADVLQQRLGVRTRVARRAPEQPEWVAAPGRYRSNVIVDWMIDRAPGDAGAAGQWTLAVCTADLEAPGRSFVFGEAAFGGAWALVSTARLGEGGGDGEDRETRLLRRLATEALHELGHVAALVHCDVPGCAMAPAADLAALDGKDPAFCRRCAIRLTENSGLDPRNPKH